MNSKNLTNKNNGFRYTPINKGKNRNSNVTTDTTTTKAARTAAVRAAVARHRGRARPLYQEDAR